jgi:hypothetical protein
MTQTLLRLFAEGEAVKCSNGDSWGARKRESPVKIMFSMFWGARLRIESLTKASGISTIVRDFLEAAAGIGTKPDPILISGGLLGVRPTLSPALCFVQRRI